MLVMEQGGCMVGAWWVKDFGVGVGGSGRGEGGGVERRGRREVKNGRGREGGNDFGGRGERGEERRGEERRD